MATRRCRLFHVDAFTRERFNGNPAIVVLDGSPTDSSPKILAKNDMGDAIVATPAIAGGRLFIRTRSKLYCVGQ